VYAAVEVTVAMAAAEGNRELRAGSSMAAGVWMWMGSRYVKPSNPRYHPVVRLADVSGRAYLLPHVVHRAPECRGGLLSASMAIAASPPSDTSSSLVGSRTDRDRPCMNFPCCTSLKETYLYRHGTPSSPLQHELCPCGNPKPDVGAIPPTSRSPSPTTAL
jgi:hypothetical protein